MSDAPRFVMSQIDWAQVEFDWVRGEYRSDAYFRRSVRAERVACFDTFDDADLYRSACEAEARRSVNPFRYGGAALFYQSSLDAPRLHDWLMDAGIEPPTEPLEHAAWIAWWDASARTWSAEQLAHVWAALDKVRFFTVSAEQPSKVYVIQELNWLWEDEPTLQADYEGGNVVRAFRSKAAAKKECDRLNRERRAQADHNGYSSFTRRTRAGEARAGALEISETVFFEVVEVELGAET